ncbi:META domain-containing protein [Psychrobacter sp. UBA5136]|uniref:META domain-containing protein n=1 Tax=Psychrobacter sp. UBA5136 TaxID=1947356 RepID=UPI0025CEF8C0|nr:META domain-containing protein [Psychrobacter sp. UBA5136]
MTSSSKTLSSATLSSTKSSFITSLARLALLPSILAASLALGACQDASRLNANDVQDEGSMNTSGADGSVTASDAMTNDEAVTDKMSAEEQMIARLSRYRWTLMSAENKDAQPLNPLLDIKDQVRLSFNQYQGENSLNYSVGCNTMSASYQLQGQTLTVGDGMSTKMSCGELDKAESQLSQLMQGASQLALVTEGSAKDANAKDGDSSEQSAKDDNSESNIVKSNKPILTQVTSDGATLIWEGKLTSQAKYNSKGETVFWAVNAKKIACADNSSEMCLQVKPITYDDQGIKVSEGEWTAFNGEIDGYQPDGMHDEVLRLQRYQLDGNESAEDEEYAYVLDAVIESAVVD